MAGDNLVVDAAKKPVSLFLRDLHCSRRIEVKEECIPQVPVRVKVRDLGFDVGLFDHDGRQLRDLCRWLGDGLTMLGNRRRGRCGVPSRRGLLEEELDDRPDRSECVVEKEMSRCLDECVVFVMRELIRGDEKILELRFENTRLFVGVWEMPQRRLQCAVLREGPVDIGTDVDLERRRDVSGQDIVQLDCRALADCARRDAPDDGINLAVEW